MKVKRSLPGSMVGFGKFENVLVQIICFFAIWHNLEIFGMGSYQVAWDGLAWFFACLSVLSLLFFVVGVSDCPVPSGRFSVR